MQFPVSKSECEVVFTQVRECLDCEEEEQASAKDSVQK